MGAPAGRMADDNSPEEGFHALATTAAADGQRIEIPADMIGKFCAFAAETKDVWIRFEGAGTVDVDETAVSTVAAEVPTAVAKVPQVYIPAGTERHLRLKASWTHFAHISAATGGVLRFGLQTGSSDD